MGTPIKQLTIEGFKSIQKLENFELRDLNVLIGANGAGKSNFIELFQMLRAMASGNLQTYVAKVGGGDSLFFGGPRTTPNLNVGFSFAQYEYNFTLEPTADGRVVFSKESIQHSGNPSSSVSGATGSGESVLAYGRQPDVREWLPPVDIVHQVYQAVSTWTVYHFHDTSIWAQLRRPQPVEDFAYLRPDASNIAAFLHAMREHQNPAYTLIRDTIRMVAPFIDDFLLKERLQGHENKVALDWHQKGMDFPFQPWHLSDGTIRFICLATALLQPHPPSTIVIDEPELGLHPHALEVIAGLIQKASQQVQVIISTQSAPLLSQFEPEDVITVSRKDGASTFDRLDKPALADWLKDYTLGELWQKNVVEAGAGND